MNTNRSRDLIEELETIADTSGDRLSQSEKIALIRAAARLREARRKWGQI